MACVCVLCTCVLLHWCTCVCVCLCMCVYMRGWVCVVRGRPIKKLPEERAFSWDSMGGREDGRAIVCQSSILRAGIRAFLLCSPVRLCTTTTPCLIRAALERQPREKRGGRNTSDEDKKETNGKNNIIIGGKRGKRKKNWIHAVWQCCASLIGSVMRWMITTWCEIW